MLPAITPLPGETVTRSLALIEKMGEGFDASGAEVEGPVEAVLGTVDPRRQGDDRAALDRPDHRKSGVGATEVWEIYNFTADAHPIHIHEVAFEVVNRQALLLDRKRKSGDPVAGDRRHPAAGAVGDGLQGHGDRVSG